MLKHRLLDFQRVDGGPDPIDQADQLVGGDRGAVDQVALFQPVQVGRAVQSGADARRRQGRGDHRGRRSLPLGAGDVDDPEPELGVAQLAEQPPHPAQPQLVERLGHAVPLVVEPAVQIVEAVVVDVEHGD